MEPGPDGQWHHGLRGLQARTLGVTWLVQTVTGLTVAAFGPLAPFLREQLGLTSVQIGLLVSSLFFTSFVLLIPAGLAVDRFGERRGMALGQMVIGIMFALASLAPSYAVLILLVTLAGIGTNFTLPSTSKAIVKWFSVRGRATAMGFKQTGFNVGGLVAATALPAIALAGGYQPALLFIGGFALVTGVVSLLAYPGGRVSGGQVAAQRPSRSPLREAQSFLTSPDVLLFALAVATFNLVQMSILTYFVSYLNSAVLVPVALAGVYLAVIQVSGGVARIGWGLVSDRALGGRRIEVLQIMAAGAIVSSVAIAALNPQTPSLVVLGVSILTGVLFFGWPGVYLVVSGEIGGRGEAGGSTSVIASLANVGVLVGPPTFGYLVDSTGTFAAAWVFLAVSMVVGLLALVVLRARGRIDRG